MLDSVAMRRLWNGCATASVCPGDEPQRCAKAFVRVLDEDFSVLLGIDAMHHLCKCTSAFAVAVHFIA
jgi:hypothetical protein